MNLRKTGKSRKKSVKRKSKKVLNKRMKYDGGKEHDDLLERFNSSFRYFDIDKHVRNAREDEGDIPYSEYFTYTDEITTLKIDLSLKKNLTINRLLNIRDPTIKFIFIDVQRVNISNIENRKKGYFKTIINRLEEICKQKKIILLVSDIQNRELAINLNKNGFKLIIDDFSGTHTIEPNDERTFRNCLGVISINAIKIFEMEDAEDQNIT